MSRGGIPRDDFIPLHCCAWLDLQVFTYGAAAAAKPSLWERWNSLCCYVTFSPISSISTVCVCVCTHSHLSWRALFHRFDDGDPVLLLQGEAVASIAGSYLGKNTAHVTISKAGRHRKANVHGAKADSATERHGNWSVCRKKKCLARAKNNLHCSDFFPLAAAQAPDEAFGPVLCMQAGYLTLQTAGSSIRRRDCTLARRHLAMTFSTIFRSCFMGLCLVLEPSISSSAKKRKSSGSSLNSLFSKTEGIRRKVWG